MVTPGTRKSKSGSGSPSFSTNGRKKPPTHESTWKPMSRSAASGASSSIGSTMPRMRLGAEATSRTVSSVERRAVGVDVDPVVGVERDPGLDQPEVVGRLGERRVGRIGHDHVRPGDLRVDAAGTVAGGLDAHQDRFGAARRDAPDRLGAVEQARRVVDDLALEPGQARERPGQQAVGREEAQVGLLGHLEHVVTGRVVRAGRDPLEPVDRRPRPPPSPDGAPREVPSAGGRVVARPRWSSAPPSRPAEMPFAVIRDLPPGCRRYRPVIGRVLIPPSPTSQPLATSLPPSPLPIPPSHLPLLPPLPSPSLLPLPPSPPPLRSLRSGPRHVGLPPSPLPPPPPPPPRLVEGRVQLRRWWCSQRRQTL